MRVEVAPGVRRAAVPRRPAATLPYVRVRRIRAVREASDPVLRQKSAAYTAYGAARKLWSCRDEEILIEGPAGTGKTRAILEKMHFCAMKYPGFRGLIVRKTRESLTESVLVTFEDKVVPAGSEILEGAQRKLRQAYTYPNGSSIVVGGMDKPSKVMSTEYDIIGCFESTELTEEDFENLTTRLRNHVIPGYQQIIADCNPGAPSHWLNRRPKTKGTTRLLSKHEDNPHLFDHKSSKWTADGTKYLNRLDRLSGARRLRLRFGKWAAAEGMVYQGWSDANVINYKAPPLGWRRIRVVDFGYTNPFVCQWWAIDEDGRMYLYREIYFSKRIVAEHAKLIKRLSQRESIEATICDWDAEDRATLEANGIPTVSAYKDIQRGIEYVQARIQKAGDNRPRLFIMRDACVEKDSNLEERAMPVCTLEEIDGYTYPPGIDGKAIKEVPVDKDNHGMDAMRYAVAYVDDLFGMILSVTAEEALVVPAAA